jgi:cobalt-zinc-cadmium efflux system outer membrane protein
MKLLPSIRFMLAVLAISGMLGLVSATAQAPSSPQTAPQKPAQTAPAQTPPAQRPPALPPAPTPDQQAAQAPAPSVVITLDQAIELAKKNNPTLRANETLIEQNKAQEITANLRPNPVLAWDTQYLPIFQPSLFSDSNYWQTQAQYDLGIGYLLERGRKRQHRLAAAQDQTAVTEAQVADAERILVGNVAQQFVMALQAKANLQLALQVLDSYLHTVSISQERYKAGAMSQVDLLKIQLQTLQFRTDVNTARIAKVQALASLRQLLGYDSVPRDYDVAGDLTYQPLPLKLDDLDARALASRPDLQAARRSITAANSQIGLARANGKVDLNVTFNYTRLNQNNLGAFYFNLPLPVFNRNQGEIARTQYVLSQSQFQETAAEQQVLTDVKNAYEGLRNAEDVVQLYNNGYLQQARQALEITQFSYEHGAASLLDFLDAERSYRSTELSYRQALAAYMSALEQIRLTVGRRELQ